MVNSLTPKQMSAIQRAVRTPELQPLLFRKTKGLKWFEPFHNEGFFNVSNNPRPILAKEKGFVNIPFWPVTEYLVASSEELTVPENKEYAVKFMDLIRKVTLHAKNKSFSNYRTWWQFAKIIRNIPTQLISLQDMDLLDFWLDDRKLDVFRSKLVVNEVLLSHNCM